MAKVFSVTVRSHMMIAHSLPHPDFGPAQALHGATYVVEATFERAELSDSGIVIDIGLATTALQEITGELTYRNLDEHPRFAGTLTTTEALARYVVDELVDRLPGDTRHGLSRVAATLREHPDAWATYSRDLA